MKSVFTATDFDPRKRSCMILWKVHDSTSSWLPLTITTSVGTVSADCLTSVNSVSQPTAIIFCNRPSRSSGVPLVVLPSGRS